MDAPPIQYVQTADGFDIAYCVGGEGTPFVFMPWPYPMNHFGLMWSHAGLNGFFEQLASRFTVVHFDNRGTGSSTRNLPAGFKLDDHRVDLDTVISQLGLERFILYAAPFSAYTAVAYAVQHPDRIIALVLSNVGVGNGAEAYYALEPMARWNWETFLNVMTSSGDAPEGWWPTPYCEQAMSQADFLTLIDAARRANPIKPLLASIRVPTLVQASAHLWRGLALEYSRDLAAAIPHSRLVVLPGFAENYCSERGETPPFITALEKFLGETPRSSPRTTVAAVGLSAREAQVLRLIAAGKSNQQMADELFISVRTVERHINHIYDKLEVRNKALATAYAKDHGIA